jgi:hypothetical protein
LTIPDAAPEESGSRLAGREKKKPPEGGLVYQGGVKEDPAKTSGVQNSPLGLFTLTLSPGGLKYG